MGKAKSCLLKDITQIQCLVQGLPFRSALRRLADRFLKKQIQQGQHDSVVDAATALDLALLKIK